MDDVKSVKKVTMHPFVDQRGMTVPEILAAVVVIMVALVALASAIPISAYGIQEGSQLTTATFLANQRLEQVKLKQWTVKPDVDARRRLRVGHRRAAAGRSDDDLPGREPGGRPVYPVHADGADHRLRDSVPVVAASCTPISSRSR